MPVYPTPGKAHSHVDGVINFGKIKGEGERGEPCGRDSHGRILHFEKKFLPLLLFPFGKRSNQWPENGQMSLATPEPLSETPIVAEVVETLQRVRPAREMFLFFFLHRCIR